jgi:hypothetical protein
MVSYLVVLSDMTRSTIIRGLKRAILRRVPGAATSEVRVLLAALEDQYSALMSTVQHEAFEDGAATERKRQAQVQASGFDLGYQHGLERALGSVGQPARRIDEDEIAALPS